MNLLDTEGHLARRLAEERENALVAQRVMDQMAGMEAQPLAEVQKAVAAASGFSGDRLVAERTPAGVLHVFLADGVGHGLVPALLALPLTQLFSAMSRKGFHLSAIVSELNRKISQYRLPGQFVAVTLAAYDPLTGYLEVWNGGNPDGLLLDADGILLRRFASAHLPLGLASGAELDTRTEGMLVPDGAQLLLYSDGLVEAEGEGAGDGVNAGARFGEQRLLACAGAHAPASRLDAILAAVKAHLAGRDAHDDISLLALACARQARAAEAPARPAAQAAADSERTQWAFSLRLCGDTLRSVDAVPVIQNLLRDVTPESGDHARHFVVLSELYNNALDHGLLQLDSRLKDGPEGIGGYLAERARRLEALKDGEIVVEISATRGDGRRALRLAVRDSGAGFEHGAPDAQIKSAPALESKGALPELKGAAPEAKGASMAPQAKGGAPAPYGRGIALVRTLADEFRHLGAGNIAEAVCAERVEEKP